MLFLEEKFTFFTNNIALQLKTSKKENRGMIQMAQRRPAGKKIPFQKDSFLQQFEKLAQSRKHHVLLESARGGRYSIAGLDPIATVKGKDGITTIKLEG